MRVRGAPDHIGGASASQSSCPQPTGMGPRPVGQRHRCRRCRDRGGVPVLKPLSSTTSRAPASAAARAPRTRSAGHDTAAAPPEHFQFVSEWFPRLGAGTADPCVLAAARAAVATSHHPCVWQLRGEPGGYGGLATPARSEAAHRDDGHRCRLDAAPVRGTTTCECVHHGNQRSQPRPCGTFFSSRGGRQPREHGLRTTGVGPWLHRTQGKRGHESLREGFWRVRPCMMGPCFGPCRRVGIDVGSGEDRHTGGRRLGRAVSADGWIEGAAHEHGPRLLDHARQFADAVEQDDVAVEGAALGASARRVTVVY